MPWTPSLPATDEPLYARLAQALQHAIAEGELPPGERLPTHRDLAFRLGLSVGTATKAYAEAERRGLIVSHVGRGSFVSGERRGTAPPATPARIDLSRNLPPLRLDGPASSFLGEAGAFSTPRSKRVDSWEHFGNRVANLTPTRLLSQCKAVSTHPPD